MNLTHTIGCKTTNNSRWIARPGVQCPITPLEHCLIYLQIENKIKNFENIFHKQILIIKSKRGRIEKEAYRIVGITKRSTSKAINEVDAMGANHLGIENDKVRRKVWKEDWGFWELGIGNWKLGIGNRLLLN